MSSFFVNVYKSKFSTNNDGELKKWNPKLAISEARVGLGFLIFGIILMILFSDNNIMIGISGVLLILGVHFIIPICASIYTGELVSSD
jgi:hypothetical protein